MKIGLVTDTSCNFTPVLANELGIHAIPLPIIFDDQTYLDGVDLTLEEFYQKMAASDKAPSTSQPALGQFIEQYQSIVEQYDKIISIHPSGKLSGTVTTAQMAANEVDESKIKVIDSELVSVLSGYLVLEAKRMIDLGFSFEAIVKRIEEMKSKTQAYVVLDNINNLAKSGRIADIASKIFNFTRIKPILKISRKGIELEKIVRTTKRAVTRMEKITHNYLATQETPMKVDVAHGDVLNQAKLLHEYLIKNTDYIDAKINRLAAVIGVHTGPGIMGYTITPDYTTEKS